MVKNMSKSSNGDHATTDRLSERAHQSVDQFANSAGKAEERIRHEAEGAKARASDAGEKAKQRSSEALHAISTFVEENPLTSLGLAFAAGTLFSVLKRRS